jgi:hypothetical protein
MCHSADFAAALRWAAGDTAILNMASWYNESDGIIDRRILR